ncbi:RPM1-interacting protein 4-like [Vicia villosa]|uniref:RPM1-interacting protein 4-like n=1 Tax=Vicia villosa TaxID=3911 RepID=UPI00273AEC0D|nr:RPM1-interacting protein 4-like [Vicia villosa]
MENLEAFNKNVNADEAKSSHTYSHKANSSSMEKGSQEVLRNNSTRHSHGRSRGSKGSFTSEFGSESRHNDHSATNKASQSVHKRSVSKGVSSNIGSFSSSNHSRHRNGRHSFNDHGDDKATIVPEFGNWDVTDPKSGEGYTVMFNKIKEERQITSSHRIPPHNNGSNMKNQYDGSSFSLSKYCCCLFTSESK